MPFQSEAQRRYLWANEPEIARDWADTYGSRIEAALGGIMRLRLANGSDGPGPGGQGARGQATQNPGVGGRSAPPGRDPRGPHRGMHYTAPIQHNPHINEGSKLHTTAPGTLSDPREKEDYFEQSWSGQPGIFGLGGGYKNLKTPGVTAGGHQSNFGIGNLFKGAASMFGGWPGRIGSFMSGMGNNIFQGRGDYANQAAWQAAKDARILQKRLNRRRRFQPDIPQNIDQGRGSGLRPTVDDFDVKENIDSILTSVDPSLSEFGGGIYQGVDPSLSEFGGIMNADTAMSNDLYENAMAKVTGPALIQLRVLEKKKGMEKFGGDKLTPQEEEDLKILKEMDASEETFTKIV